MLLLMLHRQLNGADDIDIGCFVLGFLSGFDLTIAGIITNSKLFGQGKSISPLETVFTVVMNMTVALNGLPSLFQCLDKKLGQ